MGWVFLYLGIGLLVGLHVEKHDGPSRHYPFTFSTSLTRVVVVALIWFLVIPIRWACKA